MGMVRNPTTTLDLIEEVISTHTYYPVRFKNPLNSYKFVACLRGTESLAFSELISIYDAPAWISLVATLVSSAIIWSSLESSNKAFRFSSLSDFAIFQKAFFLCKVLLDQGNPIPENVAKYGRHLTKFLLGIFLISGLVISNGHKNSNIYKMISPRRLLRYEHFVQLVDKIYIHSLSKIHIYVDAYFNDSLNMSELLETKVDLEL